MERIDSTAGDSNLEKNERILYFHQVSRAQLEICAKKIRTKYAQYGAAIATALSAIIIPGAFTMLSEAWERAILLGFDGILWIFFLVYDPREKSREARLLSKTGYAIWITAARLIACAGDNLDEEILNRAEFQKLQVLVDVRVTEFRNGHIFGDRVCRTFFLQLWPGGVRLYNIEDEELIPLTSILADVCDRNAENAPPVENLPKSSEKKLSGF